MGIIDGVAQEQLDSWVDFVDLIHDKVDYNQYIWRGHRSECWPLKPTFDRLVSSGRRSEVTISEMRKRHLDTFKMASRGRRGVNPTMPADDDEWWALGQHHGLATPLLDWSVSPFVAAFFAFEEKFDEREIKRNCPDGEFRRAIWSLSTVGVKAKAEELALPVGDVLRVVIPRSDENPRLISQAGLFTICPSGIDVQQWIEKYFAGDDRKIRLRKVTLPNSERDTVLKELNRMNINHATLFPDLIGASKYCNLALEIGKYHPRIY